MYCGAMCCAAPHMLALLMKVGYQLEGKTVLTEISNNYSPIRLNFCTQPFLSMLPGLETTDTMMAMAMMDMAIVAVMAKLFN